MPFLPGVHWKVTGPSHVVFTRRRVNGAGPGQLIVRQLKVGDFRQGVKVFAVRHCLSRVIAQHLARIIAVRVIANERKPPLEGTYQAVIVPLVMRALAPMHECLPQNSNTSGADLEPVAILKAHGDEIKRR